MKKKLQYVLPLGIYSVIYLIGFIIAYFITDGGIYDVMSVLANESSTLLVYALFAPPLGYFLFYVYWFISSRRASSLVIFNAGFIFILPVLVFIATVICLVLSQITGIPEYIDGNNGIAQINSSDWGQIYWHLAFVYIVLIVESIVLNIPALLLILARKARR